MTTRTDRWEEINFVYLDCCYTRCLSIFFSQWYFVDKVFIGKRSILLLLLLCKNKSPLNTHPMLC